MCSQEINGRMTEITFTSHRNKFEYTISAKIKDKHKSRAGALLANDKPLRSIE